MHGEEARTGARHALDPARHRVADVVQLEVEKDALAGANQFLCERKPAGEGELVADLVEHHRRPEPLDQHVRRLDGGYIERDQEAFTRF